MRRSSSQRQSRGGGFASATAASLGRGGPTTEAPPAAKPASSTAAARKASDNDRNHDDDDAASDGEKENAPNSPGSDGRDSPKHDSPHPQPPVPTVLSPTPYWKVLEERGGRGSPRTTRSASAKKVTQKQQQGCNPFARGMRELNELAEASGSSSSSSSSGGSSSSGDDDNAALNESSLNPTMLQFSPPEKQFGLNSRQSALGAKRRREAELEKHRARKERVKKARENMMSLDNNGGIVRGKRATKKARRGQQQQHAPKNAETCDDVSAMTSATTNVPAEEMREILLQSLKEHGSSRTEELAARAAAAERDAAHYRQRHEEAQGKCEMLEGRIREEYGNADELRRRCAEQEVRIDGLEKEATRMREERDRLEEKDAAKLEAERAGFARDVARLEEEKIRREGRLRSDTDKFLEETGRLENEIDRLKEGHAREMQDVTASTKEDIHRNERRNDALREELESTKSKLAEYVGINEELEAWDRENGSREELLCRVGELEKGEAKLKEQLEAEREANGSNEDRIESLRSQLEARSSVVMDKEGDIARLEGKLEAVAGQLEAAKRKMEGMQSPRSRDAAEEGYAHEVEELEGRLETLQGEVRRLEDENRGLKNESSDVRGRNVDLDARLGESNSEVRRANEEAAKLRSENAQLSSKYEENEQQLEEMAVDNEQLLVKFRSAEEEHQQNLGAMQSRMKEEASELEAKYNAVASEKGSIEKELDQARKHISELGARASALEGELATSRRESSDLRAQTSKADRKLTELSKQLQTLTDHLESAQSAIATLETKLRSKEEYCERFESIERGLLREVRVLNEIRRDLHNRVMQLSGNIRVFVRVRPLVDSERASLQKQAVRTIGGGRPSSRGSVPPSPPRSRPSSRGSMSSSSSRQARPSSQPSRGESTSEECPFRFPSITDRTTQSQSSSASTATTGGTKSSPNHASFHDLTKQTIELTEPYKDRGGLNPRRKKWKYGFDRVYHQGNTQDDVWEGAQPLVQSCVDGFEVCMFAYGQTGSGKTHTMIGNAKDRGLIPRAVGKLFAAKREIEQGRGGASVNITVELLEIYNEEVRDLLDDNAGPDGQLIKLKLNSNEAVGNVKVNARDEREVEGILQLAQERRCVKATKSNAESSRSHLLFTIHFDALSSDGNGRSGCLHIVDLAGSERLDKSGSHHGALLKEAKHINTSLSALALVVEKLQASEQHIPFRDSKLTYLLRNSLGGDSKTLAIVCCSPHQSHFNESLNSIRFAAKASKVELKESNRVDV